MKRFFEARHAIGTWRLQQKFVKTLRAQLRCILARICAAHPVRQDEDSRVGIGDEIVLVIRPDTSSIREAECRKHRGDYIWSRVASGVHTTDSANGLWSDRLRE